MSVEIKDDHSFLLGNEGVALHSSAPACLQNIVEDHNGAML
jgi:hypothetical protein